MPGAVWMASAAAAAASVFVYADVLRSYFWNDDFGWLYLLRDRPLHEVLLTPIAGHTLVARNAVFAILERVAGLDPAPYFASVLATHALNVVLLARLVWLATGSAALAGFGALAWGTCPAAGDSLAWYSVYAQVAATTCVLLALIHVANRTREAGALTARDLLIAFLWLGLGNLFFGSALAIAVAMPVAVGLLLPEPRGRAVYSAAVGCSAIVLVYAALHWVAVSALGVPPVHGDELRWLMDAPRSALLAFVQLLRVGTTSLLLGAWWEPSRGGAFLSWATLCAAGGGRLYW